MDQTVADTNIAPPAPSAAPAETSPTGAPPSTPDAFGVDEQTLASLSPESRLAVEPLIKQWKDSITKKLDETSKSFEPFKKKAEALDSLVNDPKFQSWYNQQINPQPATRGEATPKKDEVPYPTDEELANSSNDPIKYAQLLEQRFQSKYQTKMNELDMKTRDIELNSEFDQVARNHPDLWDLDKAGLFEPFLFYYKDLNKKTMEFAYQQAKKVGDYFTKMAEAKANGMVQSKKASVTETPSTAAQQTNIVYVKSPEEAMRKQIEEALVKGNRQFVVKK